MSSNANVGAIEYQCSIDLANFIRDKRQLEAGLRDAEKAGQSLDLSLNKVSSAIKVLAGAFAIVKVAQVADEMRMLEARVNVAAGSVENGAAAMVSINKAAIATQSSVETIAGSFSRLNGIMLDLGRTQTETIELTTLVAKAVKVSGASAQEAAAAQQQFAQALGAGKLNGDELRSILENAPYLARKIAEGMGVQIGALRQLGEEGKLSSQIVIDALGKAADSIEEDFQQMPLTFDAAFQALRDGSSRGIGALDDFSGTSGAVTGVTIGLTEAVNALVGAFEKTNDESSNLGRNDSVRAWANVTKEAISDIADVAQVVWESLSVLGRNVTFVFKGVGTEIGGIAAQAAAIARGEFAEAAAIGDMMKADAEKRRAELDAADAKTLSSKKKWSEQMREAELASTGAEAPSAKRGSGGGAVKAADTTSKPNKFKFDAEAYLAGLKMANLKELDLIEAQEAEKLRRNAQLLEEQKITLQQAEEAKTAIQTRATEQREALYERERDASMAAAEQRRKEIEQQGAAEQAQRDKGIGFAQGVLGEGQDPITQLQAELEQKLALLEQFRSEDMANEALYNEAMVAAKELTAQRIKLIQDNQKAYEDAVFHDSMRKMEASFATAADVIGAFAGKHSAAYKAMFAVSKAFAIADATVKLGQAIMNANFSAPWPLNFAAMASVAAAGAGVLASIKGASFGGGRQYGGPISDGKFYRVNETGAPEMYTASTGQQYMLPNKSGKITPANKLGGAVGGGGAAPQNISVAPVFQGVQMPDGWFAVRPEAVADALKVAYRDGHLAGFKG